MDTEDKETIAASTGDSPFVSAMMAVILWGSAASLLHWGELPLEINLNSRDFNPLTVLVYLFLGLGVYFLFRAVATRIRLRKFGQATLECGPARLGQTFRAVIRDSRDVEATGPYVISLRCIESIANSSGSHREKVRWQSSTQRESNLAWLSQGIAVEFAIPAIAMLPGETDTGSVRWVLEITAPTAGLNYRSVFLIDVTADDETQGQEE